MKLEHTCKIVHHSFGYESIDRSGCRLCELMPQMVELLTMFYSNYSMPQSHLEAVAKVLRELKGIT